MMILCCPVCQSTEIYIVVGGYFGQVYRCKHCGYRGSLVLEVDENDLRESLEEAKKGNDNSEKLT
jgi:C4-type Zn-finger protein